MATATEQPETSDGATQSAVVALSVLATPIKGRPSIIINDRPAATRLLASAFETLWAEANKTRVAHERLLEACRWAVGTIRGSTYGLTPDDIAASLEMVAKQCEGAIWRAEGTRHTFQALQGQHADPDECAACGCDIRNPIHLRMSENS